MLPRDRDHIVRGARRTDSSANREAQGLPGLPQHRVVSRLHDNLMKPDIMAMIADYIAPLGRRQGRIGFSTQLSMPLAQANGAKLHGQFLEHRSNLVSLCALTLSDPSYARAAVRLGFDKARSLERTQRLAHRGLADAELTCDLHLNQARTGRVGSIDDALHQNLTDPV